MASHLSRGLQETIDKTKIVDGKLRFATDTARLFMDTATERIEFTDVVKGLKYSEIIKLESPLPKLYLSSDSHQLLLYDYTEEEWIVYTGGIAPEKAITDIEYGSTGDMILTYGDGSTKTVQGNVLLSRIVTLEKQVEEMQKVIEKLSNAIEVVES